MTRPLAAIFDIGATLVTGPPAAPNKVIARLLDGAAASDVSSVIMTSELSCADGVCRQIEARFGRLADSARRGISQLFESQSSAAEEINGATDTVLELKNRGLKVGLLSDIWSPYYESVEKALPQVIDAVDTIVLSCRTGVRKPDPANFKRMLDELDVAPSQAVMIGDTYTHDIKPALDLGMQAVWVLARPDKESELSIEILNRAGPAPTATVSHITEVPHLDLWG